MANMGRALMSGLVQGFGKYANMQYDEKQKAEKAERDQELAKLQQQLKEADAKFREGLKTPQYQTYEATGADGKTVKRTIKSSYDPKNGAMEETVGESVVAPKEPRAETDREFYQRDPEGYAKYKASGQRPLMGGAGGGETLGFEGYEAMSPERQSLYDRWKGRATRKDQEAADRKWLATEEQKAVSDFDSTASDFTARQSLLGAFGIDPKDPKARDKYAKAYRADLEARFNPGEAPPLMSDADAPSSFPKFQGQDFAPKADIFSSSSSQTPQSKPVGADKAAAKSKAGDNPPEVQALIAQAEKAIQGGADAEKVKARLNDMLKSKGYSLK